MTIAANRPLKSARSRAWGTRALSWWLGELAGCAHDLRRVVATSQRQGVTIEAGERVVALLASANRDEERFAESARFDPDRFHNNPDRQFTTAGDVLPFGAGMHHCTGSRLAEVEIVETVRAVLDRTEWIELLDDSPDVGRLVLWSPSSLHVKLHPAPAEQVA